MNIKFNIFHISPSLSIFMFLRIILFIYALSYNVRTFKCDEKSSKVKISLLYKAPSEDGNFLRLSPKNLLCHLQSMKTDYPNTQLNGVRTPKNPYLVAIEFFLKYKYSCSNRYYYFL